MFSAKPSARFLKVTLLVAAILLGSGTFLAHEVRAAIPSSGTISQTNLSLTWQGPSYTLANADPSMCPPSIDMMNLLCDHFFLTINLPTDFWTSHTGTVTITITWISGGNDFDLYIYRPSERQLVGSSTPRGGANQEQGKLVKPPPPVYETRVTPLLLLAAAH